MLHLPLTNNVKQKTNITNQMNKNDDKNSSSIKNKQEQEFKNFTCSFHFANN
jgi:hypothetical protein